jgi:hypothetical protein
MGSAAKHQKVPLKLPGWSPRLPLLAPGLIGSKLVAQCGENQQRREISTEAEADGTAGSENSPPDARLSGDIVNRAGTLIDNNVGPELVRE